MFFSAVLLICFTLATRALNGHASIRQPACDGLLEVLLLSAVAEVLLCCGGAAQVESYQCKLNSDKAYRQEYIKLWTEQRRWVVAAAAIAGAGRWSCGKDCTLSSSWCHVLCPALMKLSL
jgi:hypothetical protein